MLCFVFSFHCSLVNKPEEICFSVYVPCVHFSTCTSYKRTSRVGGLWAEADPTVWTGQHRGAGPTSYEQEPEHKRRINQQYLNAFRSS